MSTRLTRGTGASRCRPDARRRRRRAAKVGGVGAGGGGRCARWLRSARAIRAAWPVAAAGCRTFCRGLADFRLVGLEAVAKRRFPGFVGMIGFLTAQPLAGACKQRGNAARMSGSAQRCNWAAGRYSPREFPSRPDAVRSPVRARITEDCPMLITPAFAQAAGGGDNDMLMSLLPFVLIFVIMYFLILRPQQKRVKQHQEMVKNVRRGDTVVTSGGLVGKVTKVIDDDQIEVEIADGVRVRQMRQMVSDVRAKGEPVEGRRPSPSRPKDDDVRELAIARRIADLTGQLDVVFLALEGDGDPADGADRVPVRGAELLPRGHRQDAGRNGRSATSCSASTCRAARTSCSRSMPNYVRRTSRSAARRRAPRPARSQRRLHRPRRARRHRRGAACAKDTDLQTRADQAARIVAAARRPARRPPASAAWTSPTPAAA